MNRCTKKEVELKSSLKKDISQFLYIVFVMRVIAIKKAIENLTTYGFYLAKDSAKERLLGAINKISHIKYLAPNIQDLAIMICKKLEEDFGGKFWIVFKGDKDGIYQDNISRVL